MLPLRAIHHSNRLSEGNPMTVSSTLADICLASYHSLQSTDSYRHATSSRHIPFDSSRRAGSNELPPDSIRPLVLELVSFLTLATRGPSTPNYTYIELQCPTVMPPLRAIYHSIRLSERIPMRISLTLADACLADYHSLQSIDSYRPGHATSLSHIPFDSSQRADSNVALPDSISLLAVEIALILYVPADFLAPEC